MPVLSRIEVFPKGTDPLGPRAQTRWLWTFLLVGAVLRLVRYLLRFPLWEDEALLSANYLDRGYLALLSPLDYGQVCPPLFLCCQLTVVKLLGFTEYTLRLVPLVCSLGSLPLFCHVARRLFRGAVLVLVVGVFAVGYPMVRYAAEAKPYGLDLLVALAMLALVVEWLRRPNESRWLWGLAALAGPAIGFSYPAVFVAGGISLAVGYVLWTFPARGRGAWLALNLTLSAAFAALMLLNRRCVGDINYANMAVWSETFPPLADPWQLIGWFFSIHSGGLLAYPVGGPHGRSTAALVCCAVGVAALVRRRRGLLLFLFLAPLGLNFVAAALGRFPYGGHVRMGLYLGSVFSILVGLGVAEALAWAAARGHARRKKGTVPRGKRGQPPFFWLFRFWVQESRKTRS